MTVALFKSRITSIALIKNIMLKDMLSSASNSRYSAAAEKAFQSFLLKKILTSECPLLASPSYT